MQQVYILSSSTVLQALLGGFTEASLVIDAKLNVRSLSLPWSTDPLLTGSVLLATKPLPEGIRKPD